MRLRPVGLLVLLFSFLVVASLFAKEGVVATLLTTIPNNASEGTRLTLEWSLHEKDSGSPFNACDVFLRLVGPSGDSTEAVATPCTEVMEGRYGAIATVPRGGLAGVVIGLAGTATAHGRSVRSDALFKLTNDPFGVPAE